MVNAKFRQIETKIKNTHTQNRKQDQNRLPTEESSKENKTNQKTW